jgi:iron complex outermembrane receptor protein
LLSTTFCAAFVHAAAIAEEATAEDDRAIIVTGQRESTLEQESATASRLGITALETPATVSTVTSEDIRARGDFSVVDAVTRAPGVTAAGNPGNGSTALSLRGFSGPGSVMQLFNGVRMFPTAGTITFPMDSWNVERIEVLSGPASVLYGQGALGGVVNVIPKGASFDRFVFDGQAGYGSFDTVHLGAGVGGPLGGGFAFRADGSYRRSDGYVDRGESKSLALSGALEFRPSSSFSAVLRHDFGDENPMKYWGTPTAGGVLDPSIRRQNYNVGDAQIDWRDNRTQLSLDWSASESLRFTNTTYRLKTRRLWENLESYAYDPAAGTVDRADNFGIIHDMVQWGNQANVTLATPLGDGIRNTLVAGVDLNWIDLEYSHSFATDPQADTVPAIGFNPGLFLDTVGLAPRYRTDTKTWAVYLEDRVEIGEQFSIIGGMRYEEDRVGRWNYVYDAAGTTITGETPAFLGGTEAYKDFDNFTWRLGAVYQPRSNVSLYAQYVTGVDPVGTLTTFTTSGAQFGFTNSTGNMIEAGAKTVFANGAGSATVAAFRIVKNDLTVQRVTNGPLEQIGQQSSQGVEASLSLNLPYGFGIDANGTLLDADFDDFASGAVDFTGKTPPGVPQAAANLGLRWAAMDRLQLRGDLRWVGRRFTNNANTLEMPSYTVVDISASYALTDHVALDLRAYNLFDKDYALSNYGSQQWVLGRPRAFDVAVRARF